MGIQYPQMLNQYFFSWFSSVLFQIFQTDKLMILFVSDELQKIYSKLLKMTVQRSVVEEASGPRSLLAVKKNKDTLLLILSIKLPTSSLSTLSTADGLQKKNLLKDLLFCHSINLIEAQRKFPIEFQFGEKCSLPGSFEYYPEEKHICIQVWKAGNKLV